VKTRGRIAGYGIPIKTNHYHYLYPHRISSVFFVSSPGFNKHTFKTNQPRLSSKFLNNPVFILMDVRLFKE
jgi:hypothetical protein